MKQIKFITLITLNSEIVYINPDYIVSIYKNTSPYYTSITTHIETLKNNYSVIHPIEEVLNMITEVNKGIEKE